MRYGRGAGWKKGAGVIEAMLWFGIAGPKFC
jgi:hypothetical protein